tara:strand:- start:1485 stop:1763 length:279 start_codon:yes stop_codon:yes gene_type:complete
MTLITTEKGQTKTTLDIRKEYQKEAFLDAVYTAEYGDHIIYHQGPHVGGRHRVEALNASEKGLVSLVQKKLKKYEFQYIAQRTRKGTGRGGG